MKPVKILKIWDDIGQMDSREDPSVAQGHDLPQATIHGFTDYIAYSDGQLILERDRKRRQLQELNSHLGTLPAVDQLFADIEQEVERMTKELTRRANDRRPAPRSLSMRLGFRTATRPH